MFDQVLGGADTAAEGWGGDSYRVYLDGDPMLFLFWFFGAIQPAMRAELAAGSQTSTSELA